MPTKKKVFEISLSSLSQNGVTCKSVSVEWEKPACLNVKCDFDGKKLKVSIPEGCDECVYAIVKCNDSSCPDCPTSERIKICPCTTNADCEDCSECVNNLCVSKCPDDKICENDRCVDCNDQNPCPQNQVCVSGDCQCPPDKPFKDDKGRCVSCQDGTCPPCTTCTPDGCKPVVCPEGVCNPLTGTCVECVVSGDCDGPNERCVDNKCECASGFVRDPFTGLCEPEPECSVDTDCSDCEFCQSGICVPVQCPDGYICVGGICREICDCNTPTCERSGGACVSLDSTTCYCSPCEGDCGSTSDCGEGCVCVNGQCTANPCANATCNDGNDCGEDCGCLDGNCVPCAALSCTGDNCSQALGCDCGAGNTCGPSTDPCAQYSCTETGSAACAGAGAVRPDCGCDAAGECVQQECDGSFEMIKGDCRLDARLVTNKCCACDDVTITSQITNNLGNITIGVHKGGGTSISDALALPLVSDVTSPTVNGNEEPISGGLCLDAIYLYEETVTLPNGTTTTRRVTDRKENLISFTLDGQATVTSTLAGTLRQPGVNYPQGQLISTRVVLRVCQDLVFANDCVYEKGSTVYDKTFRTTSDATPDGYATLSSDSCARPTFLWTKGTYSTSGSLTWGAAPFRKVYATGSAGTYTDYLDKPDANPAFSTGGSNVDNHGELWSGHAYRVSTNCGCTDSANLKACGGVGKLVFCNPDATPQVEFTSCNEIRFPNTWTTDCVVNYDQYNDNGIPVPISGQLEYGIYVNGSSVAVGDSLKTASSTGDIYQAGQTFVSNETVRFIEIKWSHDDCDECTIRIDNLNPVEKDLVYEIYCSLNGSGDIEYTFEVDFNLAANQGIDEISLNINGLTVTPANPVATFVALPSTNIVASVDFADCDTPYIETIDLPDDCCTGVDAQLEIVSRDCKTGTIVVGATTTPTNLSGSYEYTVTGTNLTNSFTNPTLTSGQSGVTVIKEIYGNTPVVTLVVTPNGDCPPFTRNITLNFESEQSIVRLAPTTNTTTVCNSTQGEVQYQIPQGFTGTLRFLVCGTLQDFVVDTTAASSVLVIPVSGQAGTPCEVTLAGNTLNSNSSCAPTIAEGNTTFNFIDGANITFAVSDTDGCVGDTLSIDYTATVAGTLTYNYNGTQTYQVAQGSGTIPLDTSTAGTFSFNAIEFVSGTCQQDLTFTTSITVRQITILVGDPTQACEGEVTNVTANATGTSGAVTYLWVNGTDVQTNQIAQYTVGATAYTVSVTVTDNEGCSATQNVTIPAGGNTEGVIGTPSGFNGTICDGGTLTLTANPGTTNTRWFRDGIEVGQGATYTISNLTPGDQFDYTYSTNPASGCAVTSNTLSVTAGLLDITLGAWVCPTPLSNGNGLYSVDVTTNGEQYFIEIEAGWVTNTFQTLTFGPYNQGSVTHEIPVPPFGNTANVTVVGLTTGCERTGTTTIPSCGSNFVNSGTTPTDTSATSMALNTGDTVDVTFSAGSGGAPSQMIVRAGATVLYDTGLFSKTSICLGAAQEACAAASQRVNVGEQAPSTAAQAYNLVTNGGVGTGSVTVSSYHNFNCAATTQPLTANAYDYTGSFTIPVSADGVELTVEIVNNPCGTEGTYPWDYSLTKV